MRGMSKRLQRFGLYPAPVSDQHTDWPFQLQKILLHALPEFLLNNQKNKGGRTHD